MVGGVASHQFSDQGAVYVHPFRVFNATPEIDSDRNTFVLGMGARFLVFRSRSTYAVAEFAPRLVGYDGGASLILIGIEKRIGVQFPDQPVERFRHDADPGGSRRC